MNPLVSTIIPVYNGEKYLAQALESVAAQDYAPLEVIVVDVGSTVGTAQIAQSRTGVRYIRQANLGMLRDIFRFLEIDDNFTPNISRHYNVGGLPRSGVWHTFLRQPHPLKDLVRPLFPKPLANRLWLGLRDMNLVRNSLDPALRAGLTEEYRADILRLQDLLQRDLSHLLRA